MTPEQVGGLIVYMTTCFPNYEVPDNATRVWVAEMADVQADDARLAMKAIVKSDQFFPTIARFRETCAGMARRRHMENADSRGLAETTEEELSMSESAGRARAVREALREKVGPAGAPDVSESTVSEEDRGETA